MQKKRRRRLFNWSNDFQSSIGRQLQPLAKDRINVDVTEAVADTDEGLLQDLGFAENVSTCFWKNLISPRIKLKGAGKQASPEKLHTPLFIRISDFIERFGLSARETRNRIN